MSSNAGDSSQTASGNARVIQALFEQLDALGVSEFCVCAGARNAAIIAALDQRAAISEPGLIKIYHFIDERGAAFFALGRIMASRAPVAVLTTSGTAVAELLPAMVEAYYQKVPLVAVTADRPSQYAGSGAPQAIEQVGIFGVYVTERYDLEVQPDGRLVTNSFTGDAGPVHINVRLEEGLPESLMIEPLVKVESKLDDTSFHDVDSFVNWQNFCQLTTPLVVLASGIHPNDVRVVAKFLTTLGAPIVAEATANLSGIRELQPLLLSGGEQALRQLVPQRVLRLGGVPSWRWWRDLEDRPDIAVASISRAPFRGLARTENVATMPWKTLEQTVLPVDKVPFSTKAKALNDKLRSLLSEYPLSEPAWMQHLARLIGKGASVFLGNSLPIREWNLASSDVAEGVKFYANRGANGIDGLVSTWLGISAECEESWLVLGDLSALYDLNALWPLAQLKQSKRRLVVINNGGGEIFSQVAWLKALPGNARKIIQNPHALGFAAWATMWGTGYHCLAELNDLNKMDDEPCSIWEVKPDARQTAAFWQAWRS